MWDDGSVVKKVDRVKIGREQTTLEQRYMAAARVRQKDNIITKQARFNICYS